MARVPAKFQLLAYPGDSSSLYWNSAITGHFIALVERQRAFLRTLIECPKYATYVRSFSWTFIWYDREPYMKYDNAVTDVDYQLWEVFSRLYKVKYLDLAVLRTERGLEYEPYTRQPPSVFFPQVVELRLAGWIPQKIVVNILNPVDVSMLQFLALDELQEEGHIFDGFPISQDLNKGYWDAEWRATLCDNHIKKLNSQDDYIVFLGPMWISFLQAVGQLGSLKHLEVRYPPLKQVSSYGECPEYQFYFSVMAELMESVAVTLETLFLKFVREMEGKYETGAKAGAYAKFDNLCRLNSSDVILESISNVFCLKDNWRCKAL
ncbi:hypothetical protein HYFRA_00013866 [Hymenoscyphus fraxineus]|uniref:Uncharacterized protein n=1 Tax=Hymenoscyphus fraxineus TaxID=746836 RepID=A0A9N9LC49_9HELO|nr:hypothetical protein HYFRA_00013866 [Hymenoscyphus fraxineus]